MELTSYQQQFLADPARFTIIEAATKTGKTTACLLWLLERAVAGKDGQQFWWVAPVYAQARIGFRRMKRLAMAQFPEPEDPPPTAESPKGKAAGRPRETGPVSRLIFRQTDLSVTLPNGACIHFRSAEKPDNLYGEDVHAVVIDEATRCKDEAWHAIRSTLTATEGPAKIIGNVKGRRNWVHKLAGLAKQGGHPEYSHYKITCYDALAAGLLSRKEIDDARESLPEHVFKELYLAEPADDGGNPFGLPHLEACRRDGLSPELPRFFGVDFGKSRDWTVVIGLDAAGQVAHFERFQGDWAQIEDRVAQGVNDAYALADSTGVGDPIVEKLQGRLPRLAGFHFTGKSKQQLMEQLAAALQAHVLGFPDGPIRDELEAFEFSYAPGRGVRYEAPAGFHDDCVCALALACKCWEDNRFRLGFDFRMS